MNDLIERQAAIDEIARWIGYIDEDMILRIQTGLKKVPSAQPERKKGHYIGKADGYADGELVYDIWSCSECGCYFEDWDEQPTYNFCPNCGAKMIGEENDRD